MTPAEAYIAATRLLSVAEVEYGERDQSYQLLGVISSDSGPRIRFTSDYAGVFIELSSSALHYEDQALYQIGHEVIHLLAPDRRPPAIMLEEGLAVHFSLHAPSFPSSSYRALALNHLNTPQARNYRDALDLYERLLQIQPNAIRKLRNLAKDFFGMSAGFISSTIPEIDPALASLLVERRAMR